MTGGKIIFMPLGGAQEVGASCYFLKLGENNLLLDCGCGSTHGIRFAPKFSALLQTPYLQDFHQVSHIFLSHAHLDHSAALPDFLSLNERAAVYMTDLTREILSAQLEERFAAIEKNISSVAFLQKIPLPRMRISFHQAGHIPGAMMTLINFRGKNILYTGDYSTFPTQLVGAALLPDVKIDILILCGLHARHPHYRRFGDTDDALRKILRKIDRALSRHKIVYCQVTQISKGVELISLINKFLPRAEIFIDERVMRIVHRFENVHIPIMNEQNHPLGTFPRAPHVILTTRPPPLRSDFEILKGDFSLHDDFLSTVEFVRRINPKICVVVHSPPDKLFHSTRTLEQVLINDPDSRTSFIFPKTGEPFEL
ncbi:MAG: MBL fold metallo-hydrolase [Selenomonadaceae bacterium]|nr:MBL fold metallo-hydrolase [Selenomonadaceae bacterium]MBQ9496951.1 MBL fold metallo-hydrolase [Selenomonadaceae bacterium]